MGTIKDAGVWDCRVILLLVGVSGRFMPWMIRGTMEYGFVGSGLFAVFGGWCLERILGVGECMNGLGYCTSMCGLLEFTGCLVGGILMWGYIYGVFIVLVCVVILKSLLLLRIYDSEDGSCRYTHLLMYKYVCSLPAQYRVLEIPEWRISCGTYPCMRLILSDEPNILLR